MCYITPSGANGRVQPVGPCFMVNPVCVLKFVRKYYIYRRSSLRFSETTNQCPESVRFQRSIHVNAKSHLIKVMNRRKPHLGRFWCYNFSKCEWNSPYFIRNTSAKISWHWWSIRSRIIQGGNNKVSNRLIMDEYRGSILRVGSTD